jgi:GAF domain-containing protein
MADGRVQTIVRDITERREAEEMQHRLHRIAMLSLHKASMEDVLGAIVETAIAVTHADFGNIQLLNRESSTLHIAAQRGFPQWWIEYWQTVSLARGICGTALERGERVVVQDVEQSPIFTDADLDIQRKAGVRAVQSTPLMSRSGKIIGMFSTCPLARRVRALRTCGLHERWGLIVGGEFVVETKDQSQFYLS